MSAHIEIPTSTRQGAKLRSLVDAIQNNQNNLAATKAVYDQIAIDGDYTALAVALGLTGDKAANDAETIYNLLGSVVGEITGKSFTSQLLSRLG